MTDDPLKINTPEMAALYAKLAAPFAAHEVKYKAQAVSKDKNSALAVAYIDARCVMDRLDDCVGVDNWQDKYTILADGNAMCALSLRFGGEWITKTDVGGPSEQPDEGDRCKAAFSDALKRAAVKFGIGRYLYRAASEWLPWDAAKSKFVSKPKGTAKSASKATPPKAVPLTEEQAVQLASVINETGIDAADLADHFGVSEYRQISPLDFDHAMLLCNLWDLLETREVDRDKFFAYYGAEKHSIFAIPSKKVKTAIAKLSQKPRYADVPNSAA